MIKMLVSSFYNTLIDDEEAIPMSTMLEIDKLRNKSIYFTICTNRSDEDVLYYNHDYDFIDYIIAYNGNLIYDVKKRKYIYKNPIKKSLVNKITTIFKDHDILTYSKEGKIYKLEIKIKKREQDIIEKLAELNVFKTIFVYNKEYYLEVSASSPCNGIELLIDKLKISKEDVIPVIGNNSEEDVISKFDMTYVVSNSPKNIKIIATHKTRSNTHKGVENVIKKYNK